MNCSLCRLMSGPCTWRQGKEQTDFVKWIFVIIGSIDNWVISPKFEILESVGTNLVSWRPFLLRPIVPAECCEAMAATQTTTLSQANCRKVFVQRDFSQVDS